MINVEQTNVVMFEEMDNNTIYEYVGLTSKCLRLKVAEDKNTFLNSVGIIWNAYADDPCRPIAHLTEKDGMPVLEEIGGKYGAGCLFTQKTGSFGIPLLQLSNGVMRFGDYGVYTTWGEMSDEIIHAHLTVDREPWKNTNLIISDKWKLVVEITKKENWHLLADLVRQDYENGLYQIRLAGGGYSVKKMVDDTKNYSELINGDVFMWGEIGQARLLKARGGFVVLCDGKELVLEYTEEEVAHKEVTVTLIAHLSVRERGEK